MVEHGLVIQGTQVQFPARRPWSSIFRNWSRFGSNNREFGKDDGGVTATTEEKTGTSTNLTLSPISLVLTLCCGRRQISTIMEEEK